MPVRRSLPAILASIAAMATMAAGCSPLPRASNRAGVVAQLEARTIAWEELDAPLCRTSALDAPSQSLSEDAAVALALWHNAAFQDLLVDLDIARADIITAGQLANPELWTVFPVGPKQLEFALNVPLEALWLRPRRLAAAELQSRQVGERLVQDALNVVRDVRVACIDLRLSENRLRLAGEGAALRERIAQFAEARLRAGDATELEATTVRVDSLLASEEQRRATHDVELARQRVAFLIGMPAADVTVEAASERDFTVALAAPELIEEATQTRPDLWARELAAGAAAERVRLARHDYLKVVGILPDANAEGSEGFEAGPGMLVTLPLFHQNQGPIARAKADWDRARRQYDLLRDTVVLEVRQAHTRFVQAEADRAVWEDEILPVTAAAVEQAERAYQGGGVPLLLVLETSRQALSAKLRHAEAEAAVERAAAELERAVGRQLFSQPSVIPAKPEVVPLPPANLPIESRSSQSQGDVSLRLLSAEVQP